jgi:hypothetical protein
MLVRTAATVKSMRVKQRQIGRRLLLLPAPAPVRAWAVVDRPGGVAIAFNTAYKMK